MKLFEKWSVKWPGILARIHTQFVLLRRTQRLAAIISTLLPENVSILDVGAGNGYLAALVLQERQDLRIEGLDVLKWPDHRVKIHLFDGRTIPLADGIVDYCMVSDVLHHCDDPKALLNEMIRVSTRGVLIKDHIGKNHFDRGLLSIMDWIGNRGHGVKLTYNYWPWAVWTDIFSELGLRLVDVQFSLSLYPRPFSWVFDRGLHFVCLLEKTQDREQSMQVDHHVL